MQTLPENNLVIDEQYYQIAREYISTFTDPWENFAWGG